MEHRAADNLVSAALVRAAADAGYELTLRMLETFRGQALLPRPARTGYRARTPVWTYPAGTDWQLLALLKWRQHTKDARALRVLLWLDGFPVPIGAVRQALVESLQAAHELLEQEIADQATRRGVDTAQPVGRAEALRLMAGQLAAQRGPAAVLPRYRRVRAADRARAFELILQLFVLGDHTAVTADEAATVEQVLGVAPNGRRDRVGDAGPWLVGAPEALFDAVDVVSLPSLLHAARTATDAELDTARPLAGIVFRSLPVMARLLAVMFDAENYAGMAGLQRLDAQPEIVLILVPWALGMVRNGLDENLQTIAAQLQEVPDLASQSEHILRMPAKTVEVNLSGHPPAVQQAANVSSMQRSTGSSDLYSTLPSSSATTTAEDQLIEGRPRS